MLTAGEKRIRTSASSIVDVSDGFRRDHSLGDHDGRSVAIATKTAKAEC